MTDALFIVLVVGMAIAGMVLRHRRLHPQHVTLDPMDVCAWHAMKRRGEL